MVLQRDTPLSIWGWASPSEKIQLVFKNKNYKITATKEGKWKIEIPSQPHGGPYTMEIKGPRNAIRLSEILIGDVWFCAGQSNMVHQLKLHRDRYAREIAAANNPMIRQFAVPVAADLNTPLENSKVSSWKSATPHDIEEFSVVAYFFAKSIYEKFGIPIGIINSSVGGTPIEAWMNENSLKTFPTYSKTIAQNRDTSFVNSTNRMADSINALLPNGRNDMGLKGQMKWYDPSYNSNVWQKIGVPGYWEDQGHADLNGVAWFRKSFELTSELSEREGTFHLGRIVDADEVYLNGKLIGRTTYQYPQRRYAIAKGLLKPGTNIITVRVTNFGGKGGFVPGKPCVLLIGNHALNLKGDWDFNVGEVFSPFDGKMPERINFQNQPSALYNAMVNPFINYKVKGFVWYHGESNAERPFDYSQLMRHLIDGWRNQWKNDSVPFVFVQLPNYMDRKYVPGESNWALIREAQQQTLSVPNSAMAVTVDLGEWNDIHPGNKKDVGERLALGARKIAYGENDLVHSGPVYKAHHIDNGKLIIQFTNTGGGLILRNEYPVSGFEIAGENGRFHWATATLSGDEVILYSDKVPLPVHVRYAWADNPFISLYNREGLPASPFRSGR